MTDEVQEQWVRTSSWCLRFEWDFVGGVLLSLRLPTGRRIWSGAARHHSNVLGS